MFFKPHLAQPCKQMGLFIILLVLFPSCHTEEFEVNITDSVSLTSETPFLSFFNPNGDYNMNENSSSTALTVEDSSLITPQVEENEENVTSGARRGRLVNGNWDTRDLALQFQGSPVFPAGGFQPILPLPETVGTEGISVTIPEPVSAPLVTESTIEDHTAGNFEDRILGPFSQLSSNIFIKEPSRKVEGTAEMAKPSSVHMSGVPPPQQTQDGKFSFDANQMAMAQAAIQAAQSLFGQVGLQNQATNNNNKEQASMGSIQHHLTSEMPPWLMQEQHREPHFVSEPSPILSMNPPSVPPPTLFRDDDLGNKRYGGPQEQFHKYHDLTMNYYGPPPQMHPYPPPPPHYHKEPYPPPPPHHQGGNKNVLGDVTNLFSDFKKNVVGTAHRFGEKVASFAGPHKWGHLVPAATTLLVGGLALKLLTSKNSFNSYNNTLPLLTLGRKKRELEHKFPGSEYVLVLENAPEVQGLPAFKKPKRRKRELTSGKNILVFQFDESKDHAIRKREVHSGKSLIFVREERRKRSPETEGTNTTLEANSSATGRSKLERSLDGTFTEEELNSLVNRLDPVQKQFLQKLQWYGFDRWKEMPCAKFILCDVIVHSDYQHIYDLERRIGLFLSLMDDESARKVEVMIKDLILSIEARDCSQFFCPRENIHGHLSQMPPVHPLPPLPIHLPASWNNHLPPGYRHPYAFPKTSETHERI